MVYATTWPHGLSINQATSLHGLVHQPLSSPLPLPRARVALALWLCAARACTRVRELARWVCCWLDVEAIWPSLSVLSPSLALPILPQEEREEASRLSCPTPLTLPCQISSEGIPDRLPGSRAHTCCRSSLVWLAVGVSLCLCVLPPTLPRRAICPEASVSISPPSFHCTSAYPSLLRLDVCRRHMPRLELPSLPPCCSSPFVLPLVPPPSCTRCCNSTCSFP